MRVSGASGRNGAITSQPRMMTEEAMALTKREEIYDAEIAPLMTQIIEVCKKHDIPLVFSAQLNDDRVGDGDSDEDGEILGAYFCTTFSVPENGSKKLKRAADILKPEPAPVWGAYVITTDDDGTEHTQKVAGSDMPDSG